MRAMVFLGMAWSCLAWSPVQTWADSCSDCVGTPTFGVTGCDAGCAAGVSLGNLCACDPCATGWGSPVCDPVCRLLPSGERLKVYGWLNAGYIGNTGSPNSKFNGPYNAVDRANELMFNQGYLVTEYGLPTDGSLGLGGRVDVLYGEDYWLVQSIGFEQRTDGSAHWNGHEYYGLAIPQAYVEAGWSDLSLKVGHFYSSLGYEVVPAPGNFFYSKSYCYQFGSPYTFWGSLLTWDLSPSWQTQVALHNGWDGFDRETDRLGVLAGVKYTDPCNIWWTSFAITSGDDFNNLADLPGVDPDFTNRTRYSWLLFLSLTDRIDYVFHHWLGLQEAGAPGNRQADWYGIDHYAYYTLNDRWKAGVRYEWFRDEEGTRLGLARPSNPNIPPLPGDIYSIAVGVNWSPDANLMVRPEVRWDVFDGETPRRPFQDGNNDNQLMLGVDAILHF